MSKLIFIASIISCLGFAEKPTSLMVSEDRTTLLAGTDVKSWYLYSITPESGMGSCLASSTISQDNTYIFHSNGTFEFDHGQITDDAACDGDGCCSDLKNLVGTWAFTNNQKGLRVVSLHAKDEPTVEVRIVLFNATIDQVEEGVLRISQPDSETNTRVSLEFRKRDLN